MKIDYIDFFSSVIPEWMARSNQKSQEVGTTVSGNPRTLSRT